MKRFIYLGYYVKKLNWSQFWMFLEYASVVSSKSRLRLLIDSLASVFIYNISLLEYFQFRFFEKNKVERSSWAGTGYMYEFQLVMNPKPFRGGLQDKRQFLLKYSDFVRHHHVDILGLQNEDAGNWVENCDKVVIKSHDGQCGTGIQIIEGPGITKPFLLSELERTSNDLVEEFVSQHQNLARLSPSGLNTIRIFTQLDHENNVEILGCRLRITVNNHVDNLAAGNLAAPIDEATGIVSGPGVYSDITKEDEEFHPVTAVKIVGFQIPFWNETIRMVKRAALQDVNCRSIGWDVAITESGPELIEGNHDWCKLLWQLPVKKGLKYELDKFIE